MTPRAQLVHSVPGRIRLKIPERKRDAEYFGRLEQELRALEGVVDLVSNIATGSVLIAHEWTSDEVLQRFADATELFLLDTLPLGPFWQRASDGLEHLDKRMAELTRGEFGVRSTLMIGTLLLGLRQVMRGQTLGPASNLLWYTLTLAGLPDEPPRPLKVRPPG